MADFPHDPGIQVDEDRLRTSLAGMAPADRSAGVLERVRGRVEHRRRWFRSILAACTLALAAGGAALGVEFSTSMPTATSAGSGTPAASSTSTPARSVAPTYGPTQGTPNGSAGGAPPPTPLPCPADSAVPSTESGRYCGPVPGPGDGLGPDGLCTGGEPGPPCGAGVVVGHFYAYTVPGSCDGLMTFDGRQWLATLTPPNPVAPFHVWIALDSQNSARWIAPDGSVGLVPYTGQALGGCRG